MGNNDTYVKLFINGDDNMVEYAGPDREKAYEGFDFYHSVQTWRDGKMIVQEFGTANNPYQEPRWMVVKVSEHEE